MRAFLQFGGAEPEEDICGAFSLFRPSARRWRRHRRPRPPFDRSKGDDILGGKVAVTADAHLGG